MTGRFACWSARNVLDLYVDGRLTDGAGGRVKRHLSACTSCRKEEALLRPMPVAKHAVEPPPELAASILRALEAGAPAPAEPAPSWTLSPARAAALVYLALLGSAHSVGVPSQAGTEPPALEAPR